MDVLHYHKTERGIGYIESLQMKEVYAVTNMLFVIHLK
jgi:hypothetical protein